MDEFSDNEIIDRSDQYGEICVALHNVAAKKLREQADECRLELEPFCEQILGKKWNDSEFRSRSNRLVERGTKRSMYSPAETNCTILIFATEYFADDLMCRELLTSYAIGLMHKSEVAQLPYLSLEQQLAALI